MPGYWWECDHCHRRRSFYEELGMGPVIFLCDRLSVDWNQKELSRRCGACPNGSLRITFEFPRRGGGTETLTVIHIVGLTPPERDGYLPMLWETEPAGEPPGTRWFHFNYIYHRGNWGLNKPAVLERGNLGELFALYRCKAGNELDPRAGGPALRDPE